MVRVVFLSVLALAGAVSVARAQSAEAEQLFRDGKQLMKEQQYAEACEAFAASQRLAPGASTQMNLADCREKNGQYATAWGLFLEVEIATRDDRAQASLAKVAKERASKLHPRLSYLTISVPEESNVVGLVITRNGAELDRGLWNRALPIDGGAYTISASAPAHEAWSTTVEIPNEGGTATVDVPKFKQVVVKDEVVEEPPPDEDAPAERDRRAGGLTGKRKAAIGVGAFGVVAVIGGALLGASATALEDDANALCPGSPCDDADEANDLLDRARSRALFANVAYGVGAAAVIGAAILWLTGAPAEVAVTPSSVAIAGRF